MYTLLTRINYTDLAPELLTDSFGSTLQSWIVTFASAADMPKRKRRVQKKRKDDSASDVLEGESIDRLPSSKKVAAASSTSHLEDEVDQISSLTSISLLNSSKSESGDIAALSSSHFFCNYCEFSAESKPVLLAHMRLHMITCPHCSFRSLSRIEVSHHCKHEHKEDPDRVSQEMDSSSADTEMDKDPCNACVFCSFMTYSTAHLENHTTHKHPGRWAQSEARMITTQNSAEVRRDDALLYVPMCEMVEDPCNACVFCNFMTYSTAYLENHTAHKHPGMRAQSVARMITTQNRVEVRKDDALFYASMSYERLAKSLGYNLIASEMFSSPIVIDLIVNKTEDVEPDVKYTSYTKYSSYSSGQLKEQAYSDSRMDTNAGDKMMSRSTKGILEGSSEIPMLVKVETLYCLACPYSNGYIEKLKCHTVVQHPVGAAVATYNSTSADSYDITFFCVKEDCSHSGSDCTLYQKHLMKCCSYQKTMKVLEKERLKSTIAYILEYQREHQLPAVDGFLDFASPFHDVCLPPPALTRISSSAAVKAQSFHHRRTERSVNVTHSPAVNAVKTSVESSPLPTGLCKTPSRLSSTAVSSSGSPSTENSSSNTRERKRERERLPTLRERTISRTMECSSINFDDLPSSISEFFTSEAFAEISDYEKQHLSNLRQNFEALRRAGLPVTPPEFMLRNRSKNERPQLVTPAIIESSDESDSEWTPALEKPWRPQGNQRNRLFEPPKTASFKDKTKENVPGPSKQKKQRKKQADSGDEEEEVHVYPFRKIRMSSYMSLATLDDDDFLYCEECRQEYDGDCPVHGPLLVVDDVQVQLTCLSECDEYSKRTLPQGLLIQKSKIPHAGLGVFAVTDFPARARFGPYRGKKEVNETIAHESGYSWQIMKDGQTSHFVDGEDPSRSNWMRYVNCARHEDEQCVTAYQYQGEIFYRSHKPIRAGTEILVYYGDSYARDLGINRPKFGRKMQRKNNLQESDVDTENDGIFSCADCHLSFNQSWYLQRHMKYRPHNKYLEQNCNKLHADLSLVVNGLTNVENKHEKCDVDRSTSTGGNTYNPGDAFTMDLANICSVQVNKRIHTGEKPYKCDVCNVGFTVSGNLKKHKRIHTGEKPYKCDVCNVGFTVSGHLKTHKRIHTGEKPYKCDVCNVGFTQSGDLKTHKRIHTGEKPYKCDVCNVCFTHSDSLKTHKRIHTGEKPYKCDVCNVGFTQSSHLKTHKRIHTGEKPYKCDVCNVGFTQSGDLKTHKRIHTGEKPYKCDVCNVCFTHSDSLKKHKRIHTGEKPYKCDVCNVGFTVSGHLKTHKRIHTGEKPYKCDVCNVGFTQSGDLKTHKRIHTGEKPYKCDVCNVCFTHSDSLKTHKRIHTGEKPYKCDVCNVGFTQSSHLKTHKRIHTGEKPYKCDVCNVGFTQSGDLKTHKRIHTGEKPYKCDVCNVCFTHSDSLKTHKRIHTGEKPYKCDVCNVCFTHSDSLKTHKRIHTGEKPYKCDVCSVRFTYSIQLKQHRKQHTGH